MRGFTWNTICSALQVGTHSPVPKLSEDYEYQELVTYSDPDSIATQENPNAAAWVGTSTTAAPHSPWGSILYPPCRLQKNTHSLAAAAAAA